MTADTDASVVRDCAGVEEIKFEGLRMPLILLRGDREDPYKQRNKSLGGSIN